MTDDELKALVAENSAAIRELRASQAENEKRWAESERRWQEQRQETERQRQESERRWDDSERRWQEQRQETERQRQESERRWQDMSNKLDEEIRFSRQEMDRLLTSFNRQLGQLGNKLGDYTEEMFRPSLERALREQFKMTVLHSPLHEQHGDEALEIDLVGHAGDESQEVYFVEIKTQLRADAFDQIYDHMRRFPQFHPEHRGKKYFGILAALDIPKELRARAFEEGIYLATIRDDVFEIVPPDGFEPRAFGLRRLR